MLSYFVKGGGARHASICTRWYVLRIHKGIMLAASLAPGQKRAQKTSQNLASASTHVLYVTGGCGRNREPETDGEKPGGNQH